MHRYLRHGVACLMALGLLACAPLGIPSPAPMPPGIAAQVVGVVDGDTIRVRIGDQTFSLRYIGIDCPETQHSQRGVEWMGPEATAANLALVGGKTVFLEKDVSETDRYGRLLRYVYLADGVFVNAELVRQGYAHAISYPPDVKHQEILRQAEREARQARRGLWGAPPTPASPPADPNG